MERAPRGSAAFSTDYDRGVTAERDELRQLVEELPDEQVVPALEDVRRRLAVGDVRVWPPQFFGAGTAARTDTAARADEILADGFGRSA